MGRPLGLIALLAFTIALGAAGQGEEVGFVVIVNASNPITSVSKAELADIFLKRASAWPDGQVILPVDQSEGSSVRAEFSQVVLKRPVSAVKSFWQKQIFSGSAVPPVEKASNADVATYVGAFHGAVGYVASASKLPVGVRVIRLSD